MGAALDRGQVCGSRYRIETLIGEGGMATVYRATHTETDRVVALKVVRQEFATDKEVREMFVREARVCSRIGRSDHIVDVLDAGIDEALKTPFIAMELLEGEPLDAFIRQRGALPPAEVVALVEQFADGLDQAHQAGVFHRDLKPQNLFLCKSKKKLPTLKILDFGIAKLSETAQQSSTSVGTPAYSAPEQLGPSWRTIAEQRGKTIASVVSAGTDIWAMGLVVYEMLTGATSGGLWGATTLAELPVKIVLEPPPLASQRALEHGRHLPSGFDAWLGRCLDLDATKRFPSAKEAYSALAECLGGAGDTAASAQGVANSQGGLAVQRTVPDERPVVAIREPSITGATQSSPHAQVPLARAPSSPNLPNVGWASAPQQPHSQQPHSQQSHALPSHVQQQSQQPHTQQPHSPHPQGQPHGYGGPHNMQAVPFDAQITAWGAHRRAELRIPDPRTYFATGSLQFLGRITGAFREARVVLHDAELVLVDVTIDDGVRSVTGEARTVVAMLTSQRLRYRAALRSKRITGIADSMSKGVKFLDDIVNPGLVFTIGDAYLEQRFELAGPTPQEAHHAFTMPLRQLLMQSGFAGTLELRPSGFVLTRDELTRFDAWCLDQLLDTCSRVYGGLCG